MTKPYTIIRLLFEFVGISHWTEITKVTLLFVLPGQYLNILKTEYKVYLNILKTKKILRTLGGG